MIARTWHGVTEASKADAYVEVLREWGLKGYRDTPGDQGVMVLSRTDGDRTHFLLVTFWESFDAIRRFAGPNPERAVYYPKDKEFLLEFEPTVTRSEEHTSELQSQSNLVCRLLLEKKKSRFIGTRFTDTYSCIVNDIA